MTTIELSALSDEALISETKRLVEVERRSMADLLALLIEVERRGLHLALGYSSLFAYCTRVLHLSEQAAYSRITAARAVRRYPLLLESLADGSLTLSSVGLLAPHLTDDNVETLLDCARHRSTREVERLIASLHPQPDIPASVRALPVRSPQPTLAERAANDSQVTAAAGAPPAGQRVDKPPARAVIAPLAPTRYFLRVTISQDTREKLERATALLRHEVPDGDPAVIIDRGLTLLLQQAERTKFAATSRPQRRETSSGAGRHIPAAVRRTVWKRDSGRCAFEGTEGRCRETAFLEFHHVLPFAVGGTNDAANLQLRCRAHNAHEAAIYFGGGVAVAAAAASRLD